MTDYLKEARIAARRNIDPKYAIALALISIAESLANSSHDARAKTWAKGYEAGSKAEGPTR